MNINYSEIPVGGILGFLAGFLLVLLLIVLAISIVTIVATWKILKKGGKPGWGALIPIYNNYLLCEMTGVNPWWVLIVLCSALLSFIPIIGSLMQAAIVLYFSILLNVSLAKSFGKDPSFAIGLIIVPVIFYSILGFGKAEYIGKEPMEDAIFGKLIKTNNDAN